MKCMVLEEFNASLVLRERDTPTPGPGETILRVGAAGACRTDLKIWHGNHPAAGKLPLVPGHEIAGEVVEVGKGVDNNIKGRHAVVFAYLSCGECRFCKTGQEPLCSNLKGQIGFNLDGGFAEYVRVPLNSLFFIRPDIPFEQAAILADAVATPYRALTSKIKIRPGETLAVTLEPEDWEFMRCRSPRHWEHGSWQSISTERRWPWHGKWERKRPSRSPKKTQPKR